MGGREREVYVTFRSCQLAITGAWMFQNAARGFTVHTVVLPSVEAGPSGDAFTHGCLFCNLAFAEGFGWRGYWYEH